MAVENAVNIEDLHQLAKKRLPKIAFDFIEGGVEDERGIERNRAAFSKHQLLPRYLVDVSTRDQSTTLFGRKYSSPFGISPTGTAGLFRRGADMMLAQAAREANVPYIMSGGSNDSIETAARVAPEHSWYQLYAAREGRISEDLIRRVADAGLGTVVLTVDVPVRPRRERNIRNGFSNIRGTWMKAALSLKPAVLIEAMTHPGWVMEYVKHGGTPNLENWAPYARPDASVDEVVDLFGSNTPAHSQTWRELEKYRRLFPRNLVVKGIMDPRDAIRAAEIGCEGVIVSNHGARQLDQAPASLDVLPAIKTAVGDRMTVMIDSGVRRGADILIALCLGAQACFFGRPTLYGAVAGGLPGVKKAVDIFRTEIDLVMGQIGCPNIDQLGPDFLWDPDWQRNR
ncbi:MAG TPA: alpha-hydroxy acid oxidase [Stellaceae bacterium]|jgi:L-lactate dehydrogenase (cytochrome)/(S)-mandelate dehydrogenase|nr:alpha-hydroxy acid oxidase [Stellaceae bacterium]